MRLHWQPLAVFVLTGLLYACSTKPQVSTFADCPRPPAALLQPVDPLPPLAVTVTLTPSTPATPKQPSGSLKPEPVTKFAVPGSTH